MLDDETREFIATSRDIPVGLLHFLSEQPAFAWRYLAAENHKLPADDLNRLSHASESDIRWAVARNWKVSSSVLERLAADPDERVRRAVARNPHTTDGVVRQLADDDDESVWKSAREAVLQRHVANRFSSEVLDEYGDDEPWTVGAAYSDLEWVREYVWHFHSPQRRAAA